MLHKTIVFITHDFDEAIRLADRIAIMNEGVIVQIGTAEDLITNPATDYVAEFTKEIPREKLLSVRAVMAAPRETATSSADIDNPIHVDDRLAAVAARVLRRDGSTPIPVVDSNSNIVGSLARDDIIDILFESQA